MLSHYYLTIGSLSTARPCCSRCTTSRTECLYVAEEGESRWQALRRRVQVLETEQAGIRELMHLMQACPESEAVEIMRRIRARRFEDVLDVSSIVRDSHARSARVLQHSSNMMQLPGIETVFEDPDLLRRPSDPYDGQNLRRPLKRYATDPGFSAHSTGLAHPNLRPW